MINNQIHPLFPTAIYQCSIDGNWNDLLHSKTEFQFDPDLPGDNSITGETRDKCLLHHEEDLNDFFFAISSQIIECLDGAGIRTDRLSPHIMKAWFTIVNAKDDMTMHTHACSDLSFVYYLHAPPKATLSFYTPCNPNCYTEGMMDPKSEEKTLISSQNFITSNNYTISVAAGDLVVFPSNLNHYFKGDSGSGTYIRSVAGDVKLVLNPDLTDFDTGMIHFDHWRRF